MPSRSNVHLEGAANPDQLDQIRELSGGRWAPSPTMTYLDAAEALRYLKAWSGSPRADPPRPDCWLYVIQAGGIGGPFKIGIAACPEERLAELQVGNHLPLRIVHQAAGGRELERRLHTKLAAHRIRGEWFEANLEVVSIIGGVLNGSVCGVCKIRTDASGRALPSTGDLQGLEGLEGDPEEVCSVLSLDD